MDGELSKVISEIAGIVGDDDFIFLVENKIEFLSEKDAQGESIDALLRILEENPDADFGMPGPIVHFVERFYKKGYESKLVNSIRRKPVSHTLWMLNRIINGSSEEDKQSYIGELQHVSERADVSNETKKTADEFLNLHKGVGYP